MLLVTFHGGPTPGINNIFAYDTTNQSLLTPAALSLPADVTASELRCMVLANGCLYVANGAKSTSNVLCCDVPASGSSFSYVSTLIGPTLSKTKGDFETSIAHPFGIVFDGSEACYVSNQVTNVVAQVNLTSNGQVGSLGTGCQSAYLLKLFPPPAVFLDGTFVASQRGDLHGVQVAATPVPATDGGLGVTPETGKVKNSVRDVAIANGILFVCDEPDSVVNMYALADGSFLGSSNKISGGPTHLALYNGGLFVSAGAQLYWSQLPGEVSGASLSLQTIALTPPSGNKIGGISFAASSLADGAAATVYIPFQAGTGGAVGGSIYTYTVPQGSPSTLPVLSDAKEFVSSGTSTFQDTPEFVLYVAD